MQQRIDRFFAALLALFEVKGGIEARMRVAPLARALFKIMDERVDIALRDVGISLDVIFGVEEAGFSYGFIIAEQRFHSGPCIASARNAAGTGRSWSIGSRRCGCRADKYPCGPPDSSNPAFYGAIFNKGMTPAAEAGCVFKVR